MGFFWIAVLVAAVMVEAMTADFVAIWFFPSALIAAVLAFCGVNMGVQCLVFAVVGLLLVVLTRPLCRRWLSPKGEKTNTDALIGEPCLVTEEIRNLDEVGEVKLRGLCWSARSADDRVIAVGEQVTVVEIRGVKLIVK